MAHAVLALTVLLCVIIGLVEGAALFVGRPYYDEAFYPKDFDGVVSNLELAKVVPWNKTTLTYRVMNYPSRMPSTAIRETVRRAFDSWSKVTKLDFVEQTRGPANELDLQLSFEAQNHYRRGVPCMYSREQTVAHAFLPEDGDIHFNTKYFFDGETTLDQFLNTAIHEIGHSLGLLHTESHDSIMYASQTIFQEPQPADIVAIRKLYGIRSGPEKQPPPATTEPPTVQTERPRTKTNLCALKSYDTILLDHRGHVCVLAGAFYYNLNETNPPPRKLNAKWPGLPKGVDTAITYLDKKTYFFKGDQYWKYSKIKLEPKYPKPMATGFPGVPISMDAILLATTGGGFHAFKEHQYWFYELGKEKPVKQNYPKSITDLAGFPSRLDAALVTAAGRRFIFRGMQYFEVGGNERIIDGPRDVRRDWFNC
ncbi:matrix metalloproteinase-19-like [Uranotaenia lowii]|uniref:matrix metalloproteinase-19-like n=1 Tax=Uranotaenia lowii TaxID=190385 RepID=UPI002479533D|nr:matrix metalloproteinase-19-like [Uranotaenia lowii]